MRAHGIDARAGKRKRTWPKPKPAFDAPNLLARCFTTTRPNEAWVADATEFETGEGTFYMAVVLDLYARRVVGWSVSFVDAPEPDAVRAPKGRWARGMVSRLAAPLG